jgi:FkbM family methyltransferase
MPSFYAQYGEDRILASIFKGRRAGVAVEVGAFDGRTGSNTLHFEENGWDCVLVEPNPQLAATIREGRSSRLFECAVGPDEREVTLTIPLGSETVASVSDDEVQLDRMKRGGELKLIRVRQRRLDDILDEAGVKAIDFITIDVEGYELQALRGFDLVRWRPRIVIIEDNSSGTNDEVLIYMQRSGYIRFRSSGCNDWYCRATDPLATRPAIIATESIKALKGLKKVTLNHARRAIRKA